MTKGLTTQEAKDLLKQYGENTITEHKKSNLFKKFIEQISSFLMLLLIGAAVISFVIGDALDGTLILIIIFLNATFGVYQEFKAEQAVAALKKMTVSVIRVIRDGKEQEIDSKYIVPGDIILIEEGVKLPADAEVIQTVNLEMNEASLTGESIPVVKGIKESIYMGTIVAKGRAVAKVIHTGMDTKFGQIAAKLTSVAEAPTPLQSKLAHLTEIIGLVGIILSFIVFILSSIQGYGYFPSFLLAVSLAVAVVPESLPAVMTVILSIGVKHMAKKKTIIRRLAAIEALGSITLIATDKTGTLTTNNMEVKSVWFDEQEKEVEQMYNHLKSEKDIPKTLDLLILNGDICSTANLVSVVDGDKKKSTQPGEALHNDYEILGDPTEGALLLLSKNMLIEPEEVRKKWEIVDEIPFDSVTKRMSVVVKMDKKTVFSKGAPESILNMSSKILIKGKVVSLHEEKRKEIEQKQKEWADHGLRVLAFSYKPTEGNDYESGHIFLGMTAIQDPPRKEAKIALEKAQKAGIRVVMITGDNERTAEAIGLQIGLLEKGEAIIRGEQLEEYSDKELMELLPHAKIFARTTPFHKSRIVSLYQKLGEVVAVTGDGVNDAIAIKQADVGIAMGKIGTDVARETADMVITDDNFATIVNAVEEGRNIVQRLKNSIKYLLTGNLSEGLTILVGLLVGLPHIFLPLQLLYINLISDGLPALALAFSPKDEHIMNGKAKQTSSILSLKDGQYIGGVGLVVMSIVLFAYVYLSPFSEENQRTAAFTVMAMIQVFIFVDIWLAHRSWWSNLKHLNSKVFWTTILLPTSLQYAVISVPALAYIFHINTISMWTFGYYTAVASLILLGIPVVKFIFKIR